MSDEECSDWDDGDEVTAALRATTTVELDPNSAGGNDDTAAAASDFDPISDWDDGDEVTAANAVTTTVAATGAKRKRKYSPTKAELRQRRRDDRRGLQMGGSGGSRV